MPRAGHGWPAAGSGAGRAHFRLGIPLLQPRRAAYHRTKPPFHTTAAQDNATLFRAQHRKRRQEKAPQAGGAGGAWRTGLGEKPYVPVISSRGGE